MILGKKEFIFKGSFQTALVPQRPQSKGAENPNNKAVYPGFLSPCTVKFLLMSESPDFKLF